MMSEARHLGRLVAFVCAGVDTGTILGAWGQFEEEVDRNGRDISDHNFPIPDVTGLACFDGWIEHTGGEDPDVDFVGRWQLLTHWETCRLRVGMMPWDPPSTEEQPP